MTETYKRHVHVYLLNIATVKHLKYKLRVHIANKINYTFTQNALGINIFKNLNGKSKFFVPVLFLILLRQTV